MNLLFYIIYYKAKRLKIITCPKYVVIIKYIKYD